MTEPESAASLARDILDEPGYRRSPDAARLARLVLAEADENVSLREALREIASEDYRGPQPRSIGIARAALAAHQEQP